MDTPERVTARGRYMQLTGPREPYLQRGREVSELTIPKLLPYEGSNGHTKLPTPYQSIGAEGVNTLAAKLLFALMPPNQPFFKLPLTDRSVAELSGSEEARSKLEDALSSYEREMQSKIEASAMRVTVAEALKHLVAIGNVLLHVGEDNLRFFPLDRYVIHRDPSGTVLEIIVKETVDISTLPDAARAIAEAAPYDRRKKERPRNIDLYTSVKYYHGSGNGQVHQEINDTTIPGSRGIYPKDATAWIPLRWSIVAGESYGRGHGEDYLGDLKSLEGLSKAQLEAAAASSKVVGLVDPNGVTDETDINEAENLEFVSGRASDVTFLQVQKHTDLRTAETVIDRLERRLSRAFLMNTSVQRAGERVTAEEIRFLASELEDNLGGVYSILSIEFQRPLAKRIMSVMTRKGELPALPKGTIKLTVTTGLEALGRGHDLRKLDLLIAGAAQTFGPEAVAAEFNISDYLTRRAAALSIDMRGLLKSPEQKNLEAENAQLKEMIAQLGPQAIQQIGGLAQKGMEAPPQ